MRAFVRALTCTRTHTHTHAHTHTHEKLQATAGQAKPSYTSSVPLMGGAMAFKEPFPKTTSYVDDYAPKVRLTMHVLAHARTHTHTHAHTHTSMCTRTQKSARVRRCKRPRCMYRHALTQTHAS